MINIKGCNISASGVELELEDVDKVVYDLEIELSSYDESSIGGTIYATITTHSISEDGTSFIQDGDVLTGSTSFSITGSSDDGGGGGED